MKKMMGLLMALAVTTTATTSVVSCSKAAPGYAVPTFFSDQLEYSDYSNDELNVAYNGTGQTAYGGRTPLRALLYHIDNLLGLDASLFVNESSLNDSRKMLVGADAVEGAKYQPSVDGIYQGEDFEGLSATDFYARYKKTHINSMGGLYQLYTFSQADPDFKNQIGTAAQESLLMAETVFGSGAGSEFINSFLALDNQSADSSWIKQTLSSATAPTELNSDILSYNIDIQESENTFQFSPSANPEMPNLGSVQPFLDINTELKNETGHDQEKIGNQYLEPFNLLMLPTTVDPKNGDVGFDTSWTYPVDDDGKKLINGSQHWDISTPTSPGFTWKLKAASTSGDEKVKGYIKTNESIILPVTPFKIAFQYTTDQRNSENAKKYLVEMTINGLQAVFSPYLGRARVAKDDQDQIGGYFAKWMFTHYQFNDVFDTLTNPSDVNRNDAGFGNFSNLEISDLNIQLTE